MLVKGRLRSRAMPYVNTYILREVTIQYSLDDAKTQKRLFFVNSGYLLSILAIVDVTGALTSTRSGRRCLRRCCRNRVRRCVRRRSRSGRSSQPSHSGGFRRRVLVDQVREQKSSALALVEETWGGERRPSANPDTAAFDRKAPGAESR